MLMNTIQYTNNRENHVHYKDRLEELLIKGAVFPQSFFYLARFANDD